MPEITGVPVFVLNIWISIGKELVMSQIVACRTDSGIVFAADSKALEDILTEIRSNLEQQTQVNEDISGPFAYCVINRAGVSL